eukprot:TRINITY_DN30424_c0_g1_i1.p1 TRINITY_DN30424_c0_g1~~TRINITY_DN30424_c0_g1_i1.p1  ORF type:complete len:603 (-),score=106.66 TRINITY_DN30424_c0_g1_i1:43-1824(-)
MVGRFESAELKRDALAHEDLCSRQGLMGRCACLAGVPLIVVGLISLLSPVLPLEHLLWSSQSSPGSAPAPPPPVVKPARGGLDFSSPSYSSPGVDSAYLDYGVGGSSAPRPQEVSRMSLDFSLLTLLLTVLALCVLPPFLRGASAPSPWVGAGAWPQNMQGGVPPWQGGPFGGAFGTPPVGSGGNLFGLGDLLGGNGGRARLIDVKPGELRGNTAACFGGNTWDAPAAGFNGSWPQAGIVAGAGGAMDWTATPGAGGFGAMSAWGQSPAMGSWGAAVPSPYGSQPNGLRGGALGLHTAPAGLPSEAEVQETYATFGVQLQQWVSALAALIDQQVVGTLLQQIDESDQLWQQALSQRGMRLTTELPRHAFPGQGMGLGMGGGVQELSVFERNLPKPLCDEPQAMQLWSKRQQLEMFLVHPSFGPSQRAYVLDRLREWRQRGVLNAMRSDWRPSENVPTDAHILENLVIKMLVHHNPHLDFGNCFLASANASPTGKHMGQAPTAYLRQVTDQLMTPKPVPHYEVVVLQKTWRLRPGNTNFLEAFVLLLSALRQHSRSYQAFHPAMMAIVTGQSSIPGLSSLQNIGQNLYNRWRQW